MQTKPYYKSRTVVRIGIVSVVCIIAAFVFWGFDSESDGSKIPDPIIRPVKTIKLSQSDTLQKRSYPGLVQPLRETKLAFRVGGPLVALNAGIGQRVEEGQVIASIDPRDFEVNVMRLEAVLKQAQANLKALKSGARSEDIARLRAQVESAQAQLTAAENEFTRQKNLLADRAASKANYDNAQRAYEIAKANFASTTQELKKAKSGGRSEEVEAAEAGIKKLQADLTAARHALKDTQLVAPYSGYISRKYMENYENVRPGEPVVSFIDVSVVEVHSSVPENVIIRESDISKVYCTLSAYPGRQIEASLKEIGRRTDSANQSYPLTVALDVPEKLVVTPGMAATLTILLAGDKNNQTIGFTLPAQSIFADAKGKTCVWRIDTKTMTVVKTEVTVGTLGNGVVQITSGLSPDDQVVTAGAKFLQENQKVRILNSEKSIAL